MTDSSIQRFIVVSLEDYISVVMYEGIVKAMLG